MQIKNFQLVSQGYSRYFKFLKDKYILIPDKETNKLFIKEVEKLTLDIKQKILEKMSNDEFMNFIVPSLLNGSIKT